MVFLDKDGTLIENVPYNVDPSLIRLAQGADVGLPRLTAAGLRLSVVSNQPGVAFGRFPESALSLVGERLVALLAGLGVELSGFHYCPHHPDGVVPEYAVRCGCRKPAPGLIERAAREAFVQRHRCHAAHAAMRQFADAGERIELVHRATNRDIFARGALHAAARIAGRQAGRYRLADLL